MKKQYVVLAVAVALVVAAAVYFGFVSEDRRESSVRVATNLPLTGELATYGESIQRGVLFALKDLEKLENSPRLEFEWGNNQGSPQNSVTIMRRNLIRPPSIYVSGVRPHTMAIWEEISTANIPHFVWIFELMINDVTPNHNNFRTWVNLKEEPEVLLQFVSARGAKRVAIAYVNLPSSADQFNQLVLPRLAEMGIDGDNLLVEPYEFERSDFRSLAVKFRAFAPDVLILNGFQAQLAGMVRSFRPLGLIVENNTIASYDMLDAAELLSPRELEGIRVVAPTFVTRPLDDERAMWIERFQTEYGFRPLYTDAYAYDMTMIIADAATRLAMPADNEAWIKALQDTDIHGITGSLRFDEDNSLITHVEVGVFRDGEVVADDAHPLSPPP